MCVILLVAIMSPLPCSFGVGQCVFNSEGFAYLEQPLIYARQVFDSNVLIVLTLVGMVSIATFNITGVTVTKEINALARSICDVGRTALVQAAGIGLALTEGMIYPNYIWQLTHPLAFGVQLIGFFILVFGNLVYTNIFKLPCLRGKPINQQKQSLVSEPSQNGLPSDINIQ